MIVDDDSISCYISTSLLGQMQAAEHIALAGNGKDALALLQTQAFDLVLLDIKMPVMDGFQFLKALQQRHQAGNFPLPTFVLLSSSDSKEEITRAAQYPLVKAYLVKPLTKEKVTTLINIISEGTQAI